MKPIKISAMSRCDLLVGQIMSNIVAIEKMMENYICNEYSTTYEQKQLLAMEILTQKNFGFDLKKQIFYKILNRKKIEFPKSALDKIQELRNLIAHSGINLEDPAKDYDNFDAMFIEKTNGSKIYFKDLPEKFNTPYIKARNAMDDLFGFPHQDKI